MAGRTTGLGRLRHTWLALAACLGLTGCAGIAPASTCAASEPVPWQAAAPGVWVWSPATTDDIDPANQGHVAATSVFIAGGQAAVIDPGPSLRHGQRVRASLQCHLGARVRWVVNTHAHAENVLGNAAFADLVQAGSAEIVASPGTLAGMRQRCPQCLSHITQTAGEQALAGTHIVLPSRTLLHGETLALGDQRLQVLRALQAHTEDDLLLWLPELRVLWAGGLVYDARLPELAQGSLDGWLRALGTMSALQPQLVIGTTISRAEGGLVPALEATRRYLLDLRRAVWTAMDTGRHGSEVATLPLPAFAGWAGYAQRQGFNVQRAWRELEPTWLEAGSTPDVGR